MFTLVHVIISLLGILIGLVAVGGFMAGSRRDGVTAAFLITTILTNVTAFGFPFTTVLPSHVVAVISLLLLAVCLIARYAKGMAGGWRRIFVITAVASLYFNVFVLIVQLFQKTPQLAALAPTQSEAPFAVTQLLVLVLFVWLGRASLRGFSAAR
jgi:hypothetical protein